MTNNNGVSCALITAEGGRASAGRLATADTIAAIAKMSAREEMDEGVMTSGGGLGVE